MRISKKRLKEDIELLVFRDIDICDRNSTDELISLIKILTNGDEYFFWFRREEDDFLTDEEINKYRIEIPEYLKQYGDYKVMSLDLDRKLLFYI